MNLKILNKNEKNEILRKLNEQFGITSLPFEIIKVGSDRLVAFTSETLKPNELESFDNQIKIQTIGLYMGKIDEKTGKIRLSIEGSQLLSDQIKKNTFELNEPQTEEWMKGHELGIATGKKDFLIITHNYNFLGTGKASENKIGNFIPKERRLREKAV